MTSETQMYVKADVRSGMIASLAGLKGVLFVVRRGLSWD